MGTKLEQKGRKGDEIIAHLTPGEIVIPRALAEDDDFRAVVAGFMRENGADPEKFIVGSDKNSTNPETGYTEFGFSLKKLNPFRRGSYFRQVFDPALESILYGPKKVKETLFPKPPKLPLVEDPSPEPTFLPSREIEGAKRRVRKRRRGRETTILGGRMMTKRASSSLKQILG